MGLFSRKKKHDVEGPAYEIDVETLAEQKTTGPFDESEHPERGDLLDAGSLWIPAVQGYQIQFSIDQRRGKVFGIVYTKDNAALQLQVFAAPRSRGLWKEVLGDMRTSIANQGGSSKDAEGPYGPELQSMVPVPQLQAQQPHRFVGIDGPRWLLRATFYGLAGVNRDISDQMISDIVEKIVVVRGQTPHPPRELLDLAMPRVKGETQA